MVSSACSSQVSPTSTTASGSPIAVAASSARTPQVGRRLLRQPHDACVVPEVRVAQLGVPVETGLGEHGAGERADQEVGEHVRARLLLEPAGQPVGAAVHVVAVQPLEPGQPEPVTHLVEGAVRAAVGVADDDLVVAAGQLARQPLHLAGDPLRRVVQQRRQRVHVDRPPPPGRGRGHPLRQRPARDHPDPGDQGRGLAPAHT